MNKVSLLAMMAFSTLAVNGMNMDSILLEDKQQNESRNTEIFFAHAFMQFAARVQDEGAAHLLSLISQSAGKENLANNKQNACNKGIRLYTCCNKHFISKEGYQRHRVGHKLLRLFKCEHKDCSFSAKDKSHLNEHKRIHTGEKPYKCPECEDLFRVSSTFQYHFIKIHHPEKLLSCNTCNFKAVTKNALMRHKFSHRNIKPFKCLNCGANFSSNGSLRRHEKLHAGDRPFKCNHCVYSAIQPQHLANHMLTKHRLG